MRRGDVTRDLIRSDALANGITSPLRTMLSLVTLAPFWLIVLHRVAHGLRQRRVRVLPGILRALGLLIWGADIWPDATIGSRLRIAHTSGIVIGDAVVAGSDLTLFPGVVLGGSAKLRPEWGSNQPRIGDRVTVLSHAVVVGGIDIGDDAVIGANVVVLDDVPANHIVRSMPTVATPRRSTT
jgi:serine O-acetyltransferase